MRGVKKAVGSDKNRTHRRLFLVTTLMTSLAKQFAVLLFCHPLAAFLNYGTHADLLI